MKQFLHSIEYLLGLHILGLLMFTLFRVVQYFVLNDMIIDDSASVLPAFLNGLWFDNVIGCYILLVPIIVVLIPASLGYVQKSWRRFAMLWMTFFYIMAFALSASNIPYFRYFFKDINSSIFGWFGYAGTTAGMVTGESSYWIYIALFLLLSVVFTFIANYIRHYFDLKINSEQQCQSPYYVIQRLIVSLIVISFSIFGIRGRTGYNPIKISEAYYCNDSFLNQLGINPAFNLITSINDDMRPENAELHLMPYEKAVCCARKSLGIKGKNGILNPLDRTVIDKAAVKTDKPNVVIILMESMSANLMQTFGQRVRLTPTLDGLYNTSLAFMNYYSAGIHTNHGITASLYSFPALMDRNLMKGTVTPHRTGIPTILKEHGYHNMFFMTHEAQYDNMNAFLRTNGYDDIYSQETYPKKEVVNAFGVSDNFEFQFALQKLNQSAKKGPFMATILTVSNHPPYVIPPYFHPKSKDEESQIVEYADWAIGRFLDKAKKQSWYKNTVFVIMADHGKMVGNPDAELPQSYNHIPLIMFGPGVKAMQYEGLAQQVDVMPTLLHILGIEKYQYNGFGINLFEKQRDMVFYSADDQIVGRSKNGCFIYYPHTKRAICYAVQPGGYLKPDNNIKTYTPLKNYVFSMIQTAEYIYRHQK